MKLEPKGERRRSRPTRSAVLDFVRTLRGHEREELAEIAGLKSSTIAYLEAGKKEPDLALLERLANLLGVSPGSLEELLLVAEEIRTGRGSSQWLGPLLVSGARMRKTHVFARKLGRISRDTFHECLLRAWAEEQAEKDRGTARQMGLHLRELGNLVEIVSADPKHHLWAMAEWLCEESMKTVPKNRDRAAEYVEAALAVAERAPGDERFRRLLGGYCWAHIGNVRRVRPSPSGFKAADAAFAKSAELWLAGTGGDPHGLLDSGRLWGMEASLRRDQGRFPEALLLIRRALEEERAAELRLYWKINHGFLLEQMGDFEGALCVLQEIHHVVPRHLLFYVRYNLAVNLCHLELHEEAEGLLPDIARLALETESADNQVRIRWLSGRVASGRGRMDEAVAHFSWLRSTFMDQRNAYDASLVSLELARLYLWQGHTSTVRHLVREMAPVFIDHEIHARAQEALHLFREAAEKEVASLDLVGRAVIYLYRARRCPDLRFDAFI